MTSGASRSGADLRMQDAPVCPSHAGTPSTDTAPELDGYPGDAIVMFGNRWTTTIGVTRVTFAAFGSAHVKRRWRGTAVRAKQRYGHATASASKEQRSRLREHAGHGG